MLNFIKQWCEKFWNQVSEELLYVFDTYFSWVSDFFYWSFDLILTSVTAIFGTVDLSALAGLRNLGELVGLPPQVEYLINYLNLIQMLGYVITCYCIRVALNFIPSIFTRV